MSDKARKGTITLAAGNRTIRKLAMLWRAMAQWLADGGPAKSGWVSLGLDRENSAGNVRTQFLKGRKEVREGWQAPTLLIDATADLQLIQPYWPQAKLTADVAAETPHMRITQGVDRSFGKHDLLGNPHKLRDVHATLAAVGRMYGPKRVLAVTQKAIEEQLPGLGKLPPNIELAHHNAIEGRDEWKDVAALVVVGRTAPSPVNVEDLAEALTGRAVARIADDEWYPQACTAREMADGTALEAEADQHPDPVAEAVRWQICEGQLVQIIGRARGVNRSETDPVDVLVLTNPLLPLPIDQAITAKQIEPSPADLMLAVEGVAFESPYDAAAAYELWPSPEAAKKAFQRHPGSRYGTNPYRNLFIGVCPVPLGERHSLCRLEYQVAGAGRRFAVAWCDILVCPEPEAFLTEKLGPLAAFTIEQPAETTMPTPAPDAIPVSAPVAEERFSVTPEPVPEPAATTDPFADLVRVEIRNTDDIPFDIPRFSVVPDDEPLEPVQRWRRPLFCSQQRWPKGKWRLRSSW
jgi:putative DNA primase/helicase